MLVEVYRGARADAGVDRVVRAVEPARVGLEVVRLAGALRARAGCGSAVDAIVVATAVRLGGGIIATGDPDDMVALAADHPNVRVWSLASPIPN